MGIWDSERSLPARLLSSRFSPSSHELPARLKTPPVPALSTPLSRASTPTLAMFPQPTFTVLVALATVGHAALFPTKPVRSTWYTLDAENRDIDLRWRDTHEEPRAAALGAVKVQLLFDDYVVTDLTPTVDASAHEATVRVPHHVALTSGSQYYLRFVPTHKAWRAVYSADFTIVNSTTPPVSPDAVASARMQAFNTSIAAAAASTLTSFRASATVASTTAASAQDALGTAVNAARAARMGGSSVRSKITFVIWPLLIGVALAL